MAADREPRYAAITADIVGATRSYEAGKPLRPTLLAALEWVNSRHADRLAVPFNITLGDEFQGLATSGADCPRVIQDMRMELRPLACRFGVGIGSVISELGESTVTMEGLAFSFARDALDAAKNSRGGLTRFRCEDRRLEQAANTITALVDVIQGSWTDRQWEAVKRYCLHGNLTRAGEAMGVTAQGVRDHLLNAHWHSVDEALKSLSDLLASGGGL